MSEYYIHVCIYIYIYIWTNGFLSIPAPGESLLSGSLVMETGCNTNANTNTGATTITTTDTNILILLLVMETGCRPGGRQNIQKQIVYKFTIDKTNKHCNKQKHQGLGWVWWSRAESSRARPCSHFKTFVLKIPGSRFRERKKRRRRRWRRRRRQQQQWNRIWDL